MSEAEEPVYCSVCGTPKKRRGRPRKVPLTWQATDTGEQCSDCFVPDDGEVSTAAQGMDLLVSLVSTLQPKKDA